MVKDNRDKKLTQRQELAVRELGKGNGLAAAARAVGVSRQTIYRWLADPGFVAAMNRWRDSVVTMAQGQVLAGLGDAAATVVKAAREGNARIAMTLLEKTGVFDPLARRLTDATSVARELSLLGRAERAALDSAEQDLIETEFHNTLRRTNPLRPPDRPAAPRQKQPPPNPQPTAPQPPVPPAPAATSPAFPAATPAKEPANPPANSSPQPPPPTDPPQKAQSKSPDSPEPFRYRPANPKAFFRRPKPVSDRELAEAIAAADALKAKESAFLAEQRRAELLAEQRQAESQQSPPPSNPSNPSPPSHPSHPPAHPPAPKKIRRAADARATVRARVDRWDPYAPGRPEPIDDLDDQFTDIWREDRDR